MTLALARQQALGNARAIAEGRDPRRRAARKVPTFAEACEAVIARVRRSGACLGTVLAFEFLVLTACRSGEVASARWDEIDLKATVWTIPAERMKARGKHRVPLSDRALGVLDEARRDLPHGRDRVFPSPTGNKHGTHLARLMKELGIDAVPSGFRSSFRNWIAECTDAPPDVCELALALAFNPFEHPRNDLLERRRTLMQQWADYLAALA